jgi:hypothetical protein
VNRLLAAAAGLAVLAVGLPWSQGPAGLPVQAGLSGAVLGTQHPVRVLAVVGALGVWLALRHGSRRAALAAVGLAAVALPIGSWHGGAPPGQLCYALALVTAVLAILGGRPARRPGRRSARRAAAA